MSYCPAGPHGLWLAEEHINSLISEKFEALEKAHYDRYQNLTSFIVQEFAKLTETIRDLAETVTSAGDYYRELEAQRLGNVDGGLYATPVSLSPLLATAEMKVFIFHLVAICILSPLIVFANYSHKKKAAAFGILVIGLVVPFAAVIIADIAKGHKVSRFMAWAALASVCIPLGVFLAMMVAVWYGNVIDTDYVASLFLSMKGRVKDTDAKVAYARVRERIQRRDASRAAKKSARAAKKAAKAVKKAKKAASRTEETATAGEEAAIKAVATSEQTPNSDKLHGGLPRPDVEQLDD